MIKFPLENATPYYLADTTASTTDSLENQNDDVAVGDVVDVNGKKATEQSKAFAIAASLNAAVNGKIINRHFSAFSAGRIWVKTADKPEIGSTAFYNASTKTYGGAGDVAVGIFLTENDNLNVIQINFKALSAVAGE